MSEGAGKSFVFDYGDFVVAVRYLSDDRLEWTQIKGPAAGSTAVESYHRVTISPNVLFLSWQEKDMSVVSQVVDFERGKVFTTWAPTQGKPAYLEGSVRAVP